MKYLRIVLNGFKRSIHPNMSLKPKSRLQLILGPNGSGKSSLMKEISPLPPEKDAYIKGGFKELDILFNNKLYKLRYEFTNNLQCFFYQQQSDGSYKNLNQGRTQSVQIILVQEHFKYDKNIHSLIHGNEKFTDMAPQRRREYFTSISSVNYDYAISVWKQSKDNLRDVQGALKRVKQALLEEKKNANNEDRAVLEKKITENESIIKHLQEQLNSPTDESPADIKRRCDESLRNIKLYSNDILKARRNIETQTKQLSIDEINNQITILDNEINEHSGELRQLGKNYTDIESELNKLNGNTENEYDNKKETLKSLNVELNNLTDTIKRKTNEEIYLSDTIDFNYILTQLNNVYPVLSELLMHIPEKPDECKDNTIDLLQNKISSMEEELKVITTRRDKGIAIIDELNQYKERGSIECPECKYSWIPNYDENRLNRISSFLNHAGDKINQLNKDIPELKEKLELCNDWKTKNTQIKSKFTEYKDLNEVLWSKISEHELNYNPEGIIYQIHEVMRLCKLALKRSELCKEINKLQTEIQQVSLEELNKAGFYKEQLNKLNNEIITIQTSMETLTNQRDQYRKLLKSNKVMKTYYHGLKDTMTTLDHDCYNLVLLAYRKVVSDSIRYRQSVIGDLVKQINEINGREKVIATYEEQINKLEKEEKTLKIIVQELSPTSGLIANGLIGFIDSFVKQMNKVIKKIWTYPLIIKIPDIESDTLELNYKFPVLVGDKEDLIPDINLGSTGIKEVVNMAFKLVAMHEMKIEEYPLFLDESGASFDFKHRQQIAELIKSILDQGIHEQIYMVSHYADSYGSLVSADVIVLSEENIIIPKENYNEYISFEPNTPEVLEC
jgi:DNA repair exonuclease SbcCD ATPase subunit